MSCVYCGSSGPFTDEHVLSRSLAGSGEDWVLRDLVCSECNALFSGYERAWTSSPLIALARISSGPAGRERKGQAYQVHPSEHIFMTAVADPISYEVDILRGLEPRLRPQWIMSGGKMKTCASELSDAERFNVAINNFWTNKEITLQKRSRKSEMQFRVAVLSLEEGFCFVRLELRSKPVDVWLDRFPSGFSGKPDPRVSVDAHGRLRFRVKKLRDMAQLLNCALSESVFTSEGGTFVGGTYTVGIRSVHDQDKVSRAVAKTVVNYAVDQFGGSWIAAKEFRPILDYCISREHSESPSPFVGIVERSTGITAIDSCSHDKHALALVSNGRLVIGLVRLYGTTTYRVHLGSTPQGVYRFQREVLIDFNGAGRI